MVQVAGDVLRFKGRAVQPHKVVVRRGPRRKVHIVHGLAILQPAEVKLVAVDKALGQAEHFRDELLDVAGAVFNALPGDCKAVKLAVGMVKAPALGEGAAERQRGAME